MKWIWFIVWLNAIWLVAMIPVSVSADGDEIIVQDSHADVGELAEIEIDVSNEITPVGELGFTLNYNSGLLTFESCSPGDLFPGSGWDEFNWDLSTADRITVTAVNHSQAIPPGSSGTLVRLYFSWNMYNGWWCETTLSDLTGDLVDFNVENGVFEVTA